MRRCIDGRFLIVAAVGRCYMNGRPVRNVLPVNGPQVVNDAVFHGFYGIATGFVGGKRLCGFCLKRRY